MFPGHTALNVMDWLSKIQRPTKHIIGHIGDGFLQVIWRN